MSHHAPVIIYHYPCPDGAFGALAAHLHFSTLGITPRFIPLTVFEPISKRIERVLPTISADNDVYLIDFSGGDAFMLALCAAARTVTLIDHHKTAAEDLAALEARGARPSNFHSHVDMSRSGATLAYSFFDLGAGDKWCGGDGARKAGVEHLFALIEDHDLWRHALPTSASFAAGFAERSLELDVNKNAALWETLLSLDATAVAAAGDVAIARDAAIIATEVGGAYPITLPAPAEDAAPLRCLALITAHPDLRSTMGNALAEASRAAGYPAAGCIAYREAAAGVDNIKVSYKVSMRSVGDVDVTPFCRAYGGGGHKNAASCVVPFTTFEAWRV